MNPFKVFVLLCILNVIEGSSDMSTKENTNYLWLGAWNPSNDDILIDDPQITAELSAMFAEKYEIKFLGHGRFYWSPTNDSNNEKNPVISSYMNINTFIIITNKNYKDVGTKVFKYGEEEQGYGIELCEEEIVWCAKFDARYLGVTLKDELFGVLQASISKDVAFDSKIPNKILDANLSENHKENELLLFEAPKAYTEKGNARLNLIVRFLEESARFSGVEFPFDVDFYLSEFVLTFLINGVGIKVMNKTNITGEGWVLKDQTTRFWDGFRTLRRIRTERSKDSVFIENIKKIIDSTKKDENIGGPFRDTNKSNTDFDKKSPVTYSGQRFRQEDLKEEEKREEDKEEDANDR